MNPAQPNPASGRPETPVPAITAVAESLETARQRHAGRPSFPPRSVEHDTRDDADLARFVERYEKYLDEWFSISRLRAPDGIPLLERGLMYYPTMGIDAVPLLATNQKLVGTLLACELSGFALVLSSSLPGRHPKLVPDVLGEYCEQSSLPSAAIEEMSERSAGPITRIRRSLGLGGAPVTTAPYFRWERFAAGHVPVADVDATIDLMSRTQQGAGDVGRAATVVMKGLVKWGFDGNVADLEEWFGSFSSKAMSAKGIVLVAESDRDADAVLGRTGFREYLRRPETKEPLHDGFFFAGTRHDAARIGITQSDAETLTKLVPDGRFSVWVRGF